MEINRQAWNTLTDDEKTALTLQIGMGKSSWEGGEIMTRSHYKYLEIKYRAEFFLKFFTDHIETMGRLVPEYLTGDKMVVGFLRLCMEQRKKPMIAIQELNHDSQMRLPKSVMNERIIDQMKKWNNSSDVGKVIYDMVKEFDRWNNFRILPKAIQEPSAYKRRIKNVYKKHLKIITGINPLSLAKLLKLYQTNRKPFLYMPIVIEGEGSIIKMKINQQSLQIMNDIGLYLFEDEVDANEYLQEVEVYVTKKKKECTDGLNFWPKYRDLIKKAKNYHEVQKITPTRRYLQLALAKLTYL